MIIKPDVDIARLIDSAHEKKQEPPREHLGCSEVGHHCERWVWLKFRWAIIEDAETKSEAVDKANKDPVIRTYGQLMRLFRRGHNEEDVIVSDLEMIGIEVTNRQARVVFGGHLSGSIDGEARNVPGAEETAHLLEFKSHNKKSMNELEKHGVEASKPQHWLQCQLGMLGRELERTLYVGVCKDDDRYHFEHVKLDRQAAIEIRDKGVALSMSESAPNKISNRPEWWQCKMCAAHGMCHEKKPTKEVNCRTCAHSTPLDGMKWHCAKWDSEIPLEGQRIGCDWHVFHPDLVPWKMSSIGENWHVAYDDRINGHPELEGAITSRDMLD
jgi:hypothetical protein